MNRRWIELSVVAVLIGAISCGCASKGHRTETKDAPDKRDEPVKAGPETAPNPPPKDEPRTPPGQDSHTVGRGNERIAGRLSDAEKQEIVQQSLLSLQRLVISSDETIQCGQHKESTTVAAEKLSGKLAELTYNVTQSASHLPFDPSESHLDQFRKQNDCNLAIVLEGGAREGDKFGNFYKFNGDLKGKVLNLTTHQVIASKTVRKQGKRALDEHDAAVDALEAAATDMATYLTDEISRKWEATSLIKMTLVCKDVDHQREADDLRIGLQRRPGVYYASVDSWDRDSEHAVLEVLCRFDVQQFLPTYVDELRQGRIHVESIKRAGKEIRAEQFHK